MLSKKHRDYTERNREMSESENNGDINMAAWILGVKNLAIQPYPLPPLGNLFHALYS